MLHLVSDENFREAIVQGLLRNCPTLDLVRLREQAVAKMDDPAILAWAAEQGRIVLTHDRDGLPAHASERVAQGLPMPGVLVVSMLLPIGKAVENILALVQARAEPDQWKGQVLFVP